MTEPLPKRSESLIIPLDDIPGQLLVQILSKLEKPAFPRIRRSCRWLHDFIENNERYIAFGAVSQGNAFIGKFHPTVFRRRFVTLSPQDRKELSGLIVERIEFGTGVSYDDDPEFDFSELISLMKTWKYGKNCAIHVENDSLSEEQFSSVIQITRATALDLFLHRNFDLTGKRFETITALHSTRLQDISIFPNLEKFYLKDGPHSDVVLFGRDSTINEIREYILVCFLMGITNSSFKKWNQAVYNFKLFEVWARIPRNHLERVKSEFISQLDCKLCYDLTVLHKIINAFGNLPVHVRNLPFYLLYQELNDIWSFLSIYSIYNEDAQAVRSSGLYFRVIPKVCNEFLECA